MTTNNYLYPNTINLSDSESYKKSTYLILPLDIKYYFGAGKYDKG